MSRPDRQVEVAVVGGGISGLTCGFWLKRAGRSVVVLERSAEPGGSVRTLRQDGWTFELGPNTITDASGVVERLCAAAGLQSRQIEAGTGARNRYIYKRGNKSDRSEESGRLIPLPLSPLAFAATPLLPLRAKLRLFREPFIPPRRDESEESVADFVRRRLGREVLENFVGPFISGVYAGDPERLSVRWAVRRIHALERDHGSLIRGALARRKGPAPGGKLISFKRGLAEISEALAATLEGDLLLRTRATRLRHAPPHFEVETMDEDGRHVSLRASRVILASPADAVAPLLEGLAPGRGSPFAEIPYAAVVSVALGLPDGPFARQLDGFGFLAPRVENLAILGCLFSSSLFEGRTPPRGVALTVLAGGATQPELVQMPEGELMETVARDLRRALGPLPEPVFTHVTRWPRAIPQYNIGHGRFVELARSLEEAFPGLHLAGNLLHGISVSDCIAGVRARMNRARPRLWPPRPDSGRAPENAFA
jgi:oxygen-dependent protoporphyrinogen oxidase